MRIRTAEDIVADIRGRIHMENSEFVTDDEVIEYFNQEVAELRGELRIAEGHPHVRRTQSYTYDPADPTYDLPEDFWEIIGVDATIGGLTRRLEPFMEVERARLLNTQLHPYASSPMYRVYENEIEILPATQAFTFNLRYAPSEPRLQVGRIPPDQFDGYNGYELAPIYGVCATILQKEESDSGFYERQKERILRLIRSLAAQRDASAPERVSDVVGGDMGMPYFNIFGWE